MERQQDLALRGRGFRLRVSQEQFTGTERAYYEHRNTSGNSAMGFFEETPNADGSRIYRYGGEVLIDARSRKVAQRVVHLIGAALSVHTGQTAFVPDDFVALPFDGGSYEDLEWLRSTDFAPQTSHMSQGGITAACQIAAKASQRRHLQYAIFKLYLSYRSSSVNLVDLIPEYEPRKFQVENDPLWHVHLANAITLAYSSIEEMQLEIRASAQNPSTLRDGSWNPVVREDLERRLTAAGINITQDQVWTVRGPPTRIERARRSARGVRATWARGVTVRDTMLSISDALQYASWLRSKVTTHRFNERSRSLTVYDAHNVQLLARRFLLEHFGQWR